MLMPALRRPRNAYLPALLAALLLVVGWPCGLSPARAQSAFPFRDYNRASPRLPTPDEVKAVGVLLVDGHTGEVLYSRNPDEHLLPASTTKLMTALIVYEKIGMRGSVTITDDDTRVEPSSIPLIPGETVSVYNLFHALLIESANDAAKALGRAVAGSNEAFIDMMNQRAMAMGCFNTHFENSNGLPAPAGTHYTSCADLMRIFRAVIAHPELREICRTKEFRLTTAAKTQILRNHNRLLGYYPGMDAAKTGWTVASRHTYAASVIRGRHELLLTLLDSPNKWSDAQILFNWGLALEDSRPGASAAAAATAPAGRATDTSTP